MKKEIGFNSFLYEDERTGAYTQLGKLGAGASLKKVARALMVLWSRGEIELSASEMLEITPDGRTGHKRGQRK